MGGSSFDFSPVLVYMNIMKAFTMFDHTADVGIEIFGRTKKELFVHAAQALQSLLLEEIPAADQMGRERFITVEGSDLADLLINFLRELLYLFNGEGLVVQDCQITACGTKRLAARLRVDRFQQKKHAVRMELKAVTYHRLNVVRQNAIWKAKVIFDV